MVASLEIKFCPACGAGVEQRTPAGDSRPRYICTQCHLIHYQNPNLVVGSIPEWQDQILLCRRAIEPRYGMWTLPGGFMENGESVTAAAARETREEANADIQVGELYSVYSLPYINQVHLLFRATLLNLDFAPGEESLEVRLFREEDIPWDDMAFRPIKYSLQAYFADRKQGRFTLHIGELSAPAHFHAPIQYKSQP